MKGILASGNLRLKAELCQEAKGVPSILGVHGIIHLIQTTQYGRFVRLMDDALPHWRKLAAKRNEMPGKQLRIWWFDEAERSTVVGDLCTREGRAKLRTPQEGLVSPEAREAYREKWKGALAKIVG